LSEVTTAAKAVCLTPPCSQPAAAPTDRTVPVGAVPARDAGAAVFLPHRVIVPREQVRSYRRSPACWSEACPRCRRRGLPATPCNRPSRTSSLLPPVGAVPARDAGAAVFLPYRVIVPREQVRSYPLCERCLPAIRATRSIRRTASSFIASKLAPTGERRNLLERGLPAMQSTRSSNYPLSKCRLKATRSANFQKSAQLKRLIISKYPVTLRN